MKPLIKNTILKLHLWLGLATGIIVFIIAITGSIYVFSEDISTLIYKDRREVIPPPNGTKLSVDTLLNIAEHAIGEDYPCQRISIPVDKKSSIAFIFEQTNEERFWYPNYMEFYKTVYVNPYTGNVIKIENSKWEFFNVVFWIHITLFLGYNPVSSAIIVWSVWIFVFMLVSGLILWWPNKKQRKQRFWFNWKSSTRWRRKNYDLHNILGFYILLLALLSALTGMFWASERFNESVKWLASGGKPSPGIHWETPTPSKTAEPSLNKLLHQTVQLAQTSAWILIKLPRNEAAPYVVRSYGENELNYNRKVYYYDQQTADLLYTETFQKMDNGNKIQALNYDLHVGTIGGFPTKLITFLMSLIVASLPITGFYIWWGKRRK